MQHFIKKHSVNHPSSFCLVPLLIFLFVFVGIVRDPFVYLFPAYNRIPSKYIPYRDRARKANEDLRKILSDIIRDRKESIARHHLTYKNDDDTDAWESSKSKPDLLTLMIMAAEDGHGDGSYLTNGELISNLAVFFVAGM